MKLPAPSQWVEMDTSPRGSVGCTWASATSAASSPPWGRKPWAFLGIFLVLLMQGGWRVLDFGVWIVNLSLEGFPESKRFPSLSSCYFLSPPPFRCCTIHSISRILVHSGVPGVQSPLKALRWRRWNGRECTTELSACEQNMIYINIQTLS